MNKGVIYAAAAYVLWGFFPIYFKALSGVPAFQIMTHRVVWCFLVVVILLLALRELAALKAVITKRTLLIYLGAGVLLAINWVVYVWGVNAGYVLETSLGYFINPLVSVSLGVIFLHERLRPLQWVPVGLAAAGVIYLTVSYGTLPWVALVLAFSFGFYGLVKKVAPLGSLHGLALETATIFLPSLAFLLVEELRGVGAFGHAGAGTTVLLALTGVVTAVPLLLFSSGARLVPLSTLGLLQYIAPTLQFFIGVFLYNEPFTRERLIGFGIIWLALLIFSAEGFLERRRALSAGGRGQSSAVI